MHVLPRIAESDPASGYLAEALMAAIAQGSDEAKARLKDFLEKRGGKVLRGYEAWLKRRETCAPHAAPLRPVRLGPADVVLDRKAGRHDLSCARRIRWSAIRTSSRSAWSTGRSAAPDRVFIAQRTAAGDWRKLTYAQTLAQVRGIAQALLYAQAFRRAADRDPVRQRHRARAARRWPR